jgi:tetratricopeptide (TPR) repeat protein
MVIPFSSGALYSTTEDLLLWDRALSTEKLLTRRSLEAMFSPHQNNYGYGWYINRKFDRLQTEHSGGFNGFSNDFARYPGEKLTIIILSNNENTPAVKMADNLAAIVFGEQPETPKLPVSEALAAAIEQKGIDFALQQYRELKRTQSTRYDFSEPLLNTLGYDLLKAKKIKEALEIFKLNVEAYPQSWNAYDSLAEGFMLAGDKQQAIKNYEKSLELNPQNKNGAEMLKKLRENN